ncbi:EAL domain-containing protein [Crocosphaera sp. XPORK-15E]|uniref:EAL domain-containing protein n=1 Tax=Crocosphaera sp. XPORK-15E TaxID=3110247 RepID=UPI002B1FE7E7|nr:EAL domain-containing protein [Crocosphaera sp. XPORK-15E]MEA5535607.1 EAL domain-containing protein [Crocosphaera sp. XPORK-15E]
MSNASEVRHLLVVADQKSRRIVSLTENTYSIGRDPNSNILLYDRQVSRHHATLLRVTDHQSEQPCYRIIDGNLQGKRSTNGIAVNGKYCLSHELKPGDLIRFGNKSQANYHIIANSDELDLLKDSDQDSQILEDSLELDDFPSDPGMLALDELFLEDDPDEPQTMAFKKTVDPKGINYLKNVSSLADSNPNPIIEIDFQGQITYLNAAAKMKFSDLSQLKLNHPILQGLGGGKSSQEGTSFVREVQVEQAFFEQHIHYLTENQSIRTYLFEITKYRKREAKLNAGKDRYRLFVEQATEGILAIDLETKHIIEANQAYCHLLGYTSAEIIGISLYQLIEIEREILAEQLRTVTAEMSYIVQESLHRHQDGSLITLAGKISLTTYQGQEILCFVVHDISERKQAEEQLQYQILHDPLTNLPNRELFNQQLAVALAHGQRHQHLLAVIFIDIDSFTHINNTLGHSIGDRVLQSFGERLSSCVRGGDTVTRWGSDEFVLLLPQIKNTEDTVKLAQRIFESLQRPFVMDDHKLQIKCSVGIAIYPQDGDNAETLLKNADAALYRTKEQGRNHYQFYSPHLTAEAELLLRLEGLLHQALEKKQFLLHYQPQLRLNTGQIVAMEALLRWDTPAFGLIMPQKFLPLTEKTDLILHLSKWVLKTACQQNLSWQKDGLPPIPVTVNLSAREFQQPHLATVVASILNETGLDPQWLELELTELTLRQNLTLARKTLQDLQNLGVRIALDDFGKGFSSLGYLKEFSFRTVKLHQAFIRDLRGTSEELGIISAILAIGKGFNLRVVAEGVETQEQLEILQNLNCEEIQGYWFSRPLPTKDATELLGKVTRESNGHLKNLMPSSIIDC